MDIRKLVWGVLFVLCGVAGVGWGAWHGTSDASQWLQAHRALREIASGDTHDLQRLQRRSEANDDLLGALGAGLAALPGGRDLAAAGWQAREHHAARRLLRDLPALLAGLALLWLGNRLLGQVSRRAGPG